MSQLLISSHKLASFVSLIIATQNAIRPQAGDSQKPESVLRSISALNRHHRLTAQHRQSLIYLHHQRSHILIDCDIDVPSITRLANAGAV
jgi:hypothetical protein